MVNRQSWSKNLARLTNSGWSKTRQRQCDADISDEAPPKVDIFINKKETSKPDNSRPPVEEDALDTVFNAVESYVCNHGETGSTCDQPRDEDRYTIAPESDALDVVFDTVETYVCNRKITSEDNDGAWALKKIGQGEKRGSVADRIRAIEAGKTSATRETSTSPSRQCSNRPINRIADRNQVTTISRSKKVPYSPVKKKAKKALPTQVVCRIRKESQQEATGLSFVSYFEKEGIFVSKIRSGSKFQDTGLKKGMKIIKINGNPCPTRVKNVIQIVKSAKCILEITAVADDSIEIIGSDVPSKGSAQVKNQRRSTNESKSNGVEEEAASIDDTAAGDKEWLGLGFADRFFKSIGYIQQDAIDEDSVNQPSVLSGEETVVTQTREADVQSAASPMVTRDEKTSVVEAATSSMAKNISPAEKESESESQEIYRSTYARSRTVHAKVLKRTKKEKLGISFVSFKKRPGVYIYEMYEDSIFQETMLEPGMKVLYINGYPCPDRVSETLLMVKEIQGNLTISALAPSEGEEVITSNVAKTGKSSDKRVKPLQQVRRSQDKLQSLRLIGSEKRRRYVPNGGQHMVGLLETNNEVKKQASLRRDRTEVDPWNQRLYTDTSDLGYSSRFIYSKPFMVSEKTEKNSAKKMVAIIKTRNQLEDDEGFVEEQDWLPQMLEDVFTTDASQLKWRIEEDELTQQTHFMSRFASILSYTACGAPLWMHCE